MGSSSSKLSADSIPAQTGKVYVVTGGFELTLGINVIGTVHLTNGLLPLVMASPSGRIVNLSSDAVNLTTPSAVSKRLEDIGGLRLTTSGLDIYAESKMLLNLWTDELQERLAAHASTKHILVNCTHPGMIASDIQRKTDKSTFLAVLIYFIVYVAGATADVGALSALFCATSDAAAAHPGKMWSPGPSVQLSVPSKYDRTLCRPAFDAINEAIKSKGGAGFHLPVPA